MRWVFLSQEPPRIHATLSPFDVNSWKEIYRAMWKESSDPLLQRLEMFESSFQNDIYSQGKMLDRKIG